MINNDQLWLITPECYILMISDGEWGLLVVNNGSFNGILGRSSHKETLEKQLDWDEIIKQSSSVDINCTLGIINWLQTTCIYIYNYIELPTNPSLLCFGSLSWFPISPWSTLPWRNFLSQQLVSFGLCHQRSRQPGRLSDEATSSAQHGLDHRWLKRYPLGPFSIATLWLWLT